MEKNNISINTLLKKTVPQKWRVWVKDLIRRMKVTGLVFISWSGFLSSLYYIMFSRAFRREQKAVLAGILNYYRSLFRKGNGNLFLLRRNIHRLEKGLSATPRRDIFALDYISETVHCYIQCVRRNPNNFQQTDILWATDVLGAYFECMSAHPIIDSARLKFYQASANYPNTGEKIPYKREMKDSPVHYEALYNLSLRRRSVRRFLDKEVPRELIDRALRIASLAPSACNRQPFYYKVFDEKMIVSRLASIPMGAKDFYHNIPTLAVLIGNLSAFQNERDRHIIYIDASLSAMAFMYALETLEISSCPINWPDIASKEKKMSRMLQLKTYERIIMLIAFGYPDPEGLVLYSQKKGLSEMRSFNDILL